MEHEWAEAYLRKDLAWYDRHVAKEFRTVSNGQIVSRDEVIEHVRTSPPAKQVKVDQVEVRVYGDTAIALLTESFTNANGSLGKLRMTDVWVKSKAGHWMAVHSHETSLDADKH